MKNHDLKKKLRVEFINEAAIDMGGVRKEWFLLAVRDIFSPLYGKISLSYIICISSFKFHRFKRNVYIYQRDKCLLVSLVLN